VLVPTCAPTPAPTFTLTLTPVIATARREMKRLAKAAEKDAKKSEAAAPEADTAGPEDDDESDPSAFYENRSKWVANEKVGQ